MFLDSVSALEMLRSDSPGIENGLEFDVPKDTEVSLEDQVEYAVSCLKGWGCPVQLDGKDSRGSRVSDPQIMGRVVSGLVEALRKSQSEREQQQDATSRLQSDLKVLQSVRRRLEEEKEACARDLGSMKNKLLVHEDQSKQQLRQGDKLREALQRQIKELKQRQVQQDHAMKKRDCELEQVQRQLQSNFRRSTSLQHQPPNQPGTSAEAGCGLQANRRDGCAGEAAAGAGVGAEPVHQGRNAARRIAAPCQQQGTAEGLAQRVCELQLELEATRESQAHAQAQLRALVDRAEELGFAPALALTNGSRPHSAGHHLPLPSTAHSRLPQPLGCSRGMDVGGLGRAGRVEVGCEEPGAGAGRGLRERCARWRALWLSSRGSADIELLRQQLETAEGLLQHQGQELDATAYAHRQQLDHAATLEARIIALEARLEAALQQGSSPARPAGHRQAESAPSPSFRPASCSPPPAAVGITGATAEAAGERRRRSLSSPGSGVKLSSGRDVAACEGGGAWSWGQLAARCRAPGVEPVRGDGEPQGAAAQQLHGGAAR